MTFKNYPEYFSIIVGKQGGVFLFDLKSIPKLKFKTETKQFKPLCIIITICLCISLYYTPFLQHTKKLQKLNQ